MNANWGVFDQDRAFHDRDEEAIANIDDCIAL
jgi:hypothetical protein